MLTPAQIKAHRFASAVRGTYKSDDVDIFFEEVVNSYEQVFKENADFIKKISLLANRVEAYRNDEDNIKATLLTAQRTADKMLHDAKETAEAQLKEAGEKLDYAESHAKAREQLIVEEANKKSAEKINDAEREAQRIISDADRQVAEILESAKKEALEQLERTKEELKAEELSLELLKKESAAFKGELLEKYRQHMEFIDAIPGAVYATVHHNESTEQAESPVVENDIHEIADDSEEIAPGETENIIEDSREDLQAESFAAFNNYEAENGSHTLPEAEQNFSEPVSGEDEDIGEVSGLFTLRQKAMAQQQELSDMEPETDLAEKEDAAFAEDEVYSSPADDIEESKEPEEDISAPEDDFNEPEPVKETSDFDDLGGFRVFLENLEDDDEIEPAGISGDPDEDTIAVDTFEIDKDDDDDDDDGDKERQTGFKGFFRK